MMSRSQQMEAMIYKFRIISNEQGFRAMCAPSAWCLIYKCMYVRCTIAHPLNSILMAGHTVHTATKYAILAVEKGIS